MELRVLFPMVIWSNLFANSMSDCVNSMCGHFEICKSLYQDFRPFFEEETRVYAECCNLCASTKKCASFNYDVKSHKCSLLANASEALGQSIKMINGKYRNEREKGSKHVCRTRPCKPDQVCVTTMSGNSHICLQGSTCLDIPPIEHMTSDRTGLTLTSGQAVYTCDKGFKRINGSGHSDCTEDSKWTTPSLACEEASCGHPPAREHQSVTSVKSTLYLAGVEYTCATGYSQTEGSGVSSCQDDGTWSVPTLKCQVIDCGKPADVENTEKSQVHGTTYMSQVTFTCSLGFTSNGGDPNTECRANGRWSQTKLKCNIVDCGNPPGSTINQVQFVATTYQSVATYQCGLGYYIPGNGTSVCQADGQWSETCQRIPNLRGTHSLEASAETQLECRNVMSDPVLRSHWTYQQAASCALDEVLSGCSAVAEQKAEMYGSWVSSTLQCVTDTTLGARSVARCCKIPGIKCEYIRSVTSSASCYKDFQLLDCSCSEDSTTGRCGMTMTNNSCESNSNLKAYRYAVCCINDQLACHVKELSVSGKTEDVEVTTTCERGETMTACSAFNTNTQVEKALIEVRNGVDTCVVDPGSSSLNILKAYASCCKLK